jgi:molybdopterin molybdotransferase
MQKEITVNQASELIFKNTNIKNNFEYLPIEDCISKISCEDINAKRNAPAFDNSSMDGYALSSTQSGKKLPIVGTIFAGDLKTYTLKENECYKIMTGAKLPKNCDCIVPFENAIDSDDTFATMPLNLFNNQNCRLQGEEFKINKPLIKKGDTLSAQAIALLASQGITYAKAYKSFSIAIVSSGDELIEPWNNANEYQIYNSNTITLKMLLKGYGFEADYKGVFPDNLEKSKKFISNLKDYDVIITTGGVSMGEADFVGEAFIQNNMKPIFHKIKLKPGRPMLYGTMDKTSIFALPGNPMSSFLVGLNFVIPALFKMIGSNNMYFNPIIA